MAKEIKYKITLLRFLISTFVTLFFVGCKNTYEIKENIPGTGGTAEPARDWRRIFITTTPTKGNLGGKAGADAKCMAEAPSTGTYKAMLVGDGREASPTPTDWVLSADTQYRQLDDSTIIGSTDVSRIFSSNLTSVFGSAGTPKSWTGLNTDWTSSAQHCNDWTDDTQSFYGRYSTSNPSYDLNTYSYYNWSYSSGYCDYNLNLICVEQT